MMSFRKRFYFCYLPGDSGGSRRRHGLSRYNSRLLTLTSSRSLEPGTSRSLNGQQQNPLLTGSGEDNSGDDESRLFPGPSQGTARGTGQGAAQVVAQPDELQRERKELLPEHERSTSLHLRMLARRTGKDLCVAAQRYSLLFSLSVSCYRSLLLCGLELVVKLLV